MRTCFSLLALAFLLPGCASWATYNKQRDFIENGPSAVFIDAKQRAVLSNQLPNAGSPSSSVRRFCAEPSPDALSAFAATAGLNLSIPSKGDAAYSQAFSEGAVSIGLRTQSIQLLRDVMFSNCEAFINQGITGFGLETMQRRFQSTLVAVLAIEQLTGATKAQQAGIGGAAAANSAEVLGAAIKLVAEAEAAAKASKAQFDKDDAAATAAKTAFEEFKTAHKDDVTSDGYLSAKKKSDTAAAALATSKAANSDREADLDSARAVRAAATTSGGSGSVAIAFGPNAPDGKMDPEVAKEVSKAVVQIVQSTLELGFGREVCTTLFGQMIADNKLRSVLEGQDATMLVQTCLSYLQEDILTAKATRDRYDQTTKNYARSVDIIEKVLSQVATGKISQENAVKIFNALNLTVGGPNDSEADAIPPAPLKKIFGPGAFPLGPLIK